MSTISAFLTNDPDASPQDIQISSQRQVVIARGAEDIRQRVIERLRHWRGEWFLDRDSGMPYLEAILQRPVNAVLASSAIRSQIRSVNGVTGVRNVSSSLDPITRVRRWSAIVSWEEGEIEVTV